MIGVDGTFLRGYARGILLTAIGIDADDSMYPLAFAVTQKENTFNWKWFIGLLKNSLELGDGSNLTLMSDMQKVSLIPICILIYEIYVILMYMLFVA